MTDHMLDIHGKCRREIEELKGKLAQVRSDHERQLLVHTGAYVEVSQRLAKRDELEDRRAVHVADVEAKLAKAERERDSLARRCAVRYEETEKLRAELHYVLPVVEAAKAWRARLVERTDDWMLDPVAIALKDALDAYTAGQDDPGRASGRTGGEDEAGERACGHWVHGLRLTRGSSVSFTPEAWAEIESHRAACPRWAADGPERKAAS